MKNNIFRLVCCGLLLVSVQLRAQDVQITVVMQPASVAVGGMGTIQVQICNNSFTQTVAANKLRPLVSIPSGISVIPTTPTIEAGVGSNPDNWTLMTNTGSALRMTNSQAIDPGTCSTYNINIQGTTEGGPSTITGTIAFNGAQTTGNILSNDNNTTSITVTKPLPVTLVAFNAVKETNTVQLSWRTTAETNSDYFEVQRSANAKNWLPIGTKSANGESSVLRQYGFTDEKPLEGLNYYRLKMVDKDLTYAYSSIQSLNFGEENNGLVSLYPNPAQDQIRIKADDIASIERIEIITANGQLLYRQNRDSSAIDDRINVKDLRSGIYVVRLTRTDGSVTALKIIKQ